MKARKIIINAILSGINEEIDIAIQNSSISDINKIDGTGRTALMHAAERKVPLMVAKLLVVKADPELKCTAKMK